VRGRRERRRKQLLGDLKENTEYLKLKDEVLERTMWGSRNSLWRRLWSCRKTEIHNRPDIGHSVSVLPHYTRFGTLIVATIYLQLIRN